jgi:N-acetylmuramoyl-L-alanine amidase
MAFKIAYGAGHKLDTAGKRIPKELDANQTREWVLNDRVARYFAEAAKQYDVELLRLDDPAGKKSATLEHRVKKANDWKANFYLSIHHNAGAKLTKAGGIVAFSYPKCEKAAKYRNAIYDACIANGGIRGNRATPKKTAKYYVLKYSKMDAVLVEYGFMDSKNDYKIILTEEYAKKMVDDGVDCVIMTST